MATGIQAETDFKHVFLANWLALSIFLLAVYLCFFHLCVGRDFTTCALIGIAFSSVWWFVCWARRELFLNRFEYLIHQVVGLDIFLEGFNPLHSGYGFYFCALGFWTVFAGYRWSQHRSASGA